VTSESRVSVLICIIVLVFAATALLVLNTTRSTSAATLRAYNAFYASNNAGPDVEFYWDAEHTQPVTKLNWGELAPGSTKTVSVWCRDVAAYSVFLLNPSTDNWNPPDSEEYLRFSWSYLGEIIRNDSSIQLSLSLSVSLSINRNITTFSFDIDIPSSQASRLDFDKNGRIDMTDLMIILQHCGARLGNANYSTDYDLNLDNRIDMQDVMIETSHFGQKIS
jgi:hypothetical protein